MDSLLGRPGWPANVITWTVHSRRGDLALCTANACRIGEAAVAPKSRPCPCFLQRRRAGLRGPPYARGATAIVFGLAGLEDRLSGSCGPAQHFLDGLSPTAAVSVDELDVNCSPGIRLTV
jgi:hypothetical protein